MSDIRQQQAAAGSSRNNSRRFPDSATPTTHDSRPRTQATRQWSPPLTEDSPSEESATPAENRPGERSQTRARRLPATARPKPEQAIPESAAEPARPEPARAENKPAGPEQRGGRPAAGVKTEYRQMSDVRLFFAEEAKSFLKKCFLIIMSH